MRAAGADVAAPGPRRRLLRRAAPARRPRAARRSGSPARVIASMPGDAPIVVNSAGCGAAMKDYGRLLGTAEAEAFSARVRDFSEWVAEQGPLAAPRHRHDARRAGSVPPPARAARARRGAHRARRRAYALVETDDDGLCCGAGGAYAVLQPELATAHPRPQGRRAAPRRSPTAVVVSANPGCMLHLRQAGLDVRHPADLLAAALRGGHRWTLTATKSIAERLAAIEEELRDLAYDRLRDRARDPDSDAGQAANKDEKRLEQARRAVAKAINALAAPEPPTTDGDRLSAAVVEPLDQHVQARVRVAVEAHAQAGEIGNVAVGDLGLARAAPARSRRS